MIYNWYQSGGTLLTTVTGSSLWTPPSAGDYYVEVTNTVLTDTGSSSRNLILTGNTISFSPDGTAPVVTLIGSNPLTLTVGDTFTEPGASWTDDIDGSGTTFTGTYGSTGSFAVTGTMNTAIAGTYTLTYKKVDTTGNSGSTTRTVTVNPPASTNSNVGPGGDSRGGG